MAPIRDWHQAISTSIAQIAFSDKILSGYIIFIAILLIAPWNAIGGLIGTSIGTFVSYFYYKNDFYKEWKKGYFSFSTGILGVILGGYLVYSSVYLFILIISLIFCSFFDIFLRRIFIKIALPTFATSAILTSWLLFIILNYGNKIFWVSINILPFGIWSVYFFVLGVVVTLFLKNKKATLITTLLVVITIFFAENFMKLSIGQSSGLWAFNVSTAAYLSSIIFLPLGPIGLLLTLATTLISSIIWCAWVFSNFWMLVPPIIAPFILSISLMIILTNKIFGPLIYFPEIWKIIEQIKINKKKICVLTGAGVSTPSDIPDYVSGEWLDKNKKIEEYNFKNFLSKIESRKIYWEVCSKFYNVAKTAKPNIIHKTLSELERHNILDSIITQNVDGLHQSAGSKSVIELHGNISKISCIECRKPHKWSKIKNEWMKKDILCGRCKGFVKPSVVAMGQDLEPIVWKEAQLMIKESKLLLILGTQLSITSAITLLNIARENKIKIIIINNSPVAIPLEKNETMLYFPLEKFFKTLSCAI